MTCELTKIRAIYSFPEAFETSVEGHRTMMVDRPDAYVPHFLEFYCVEHDCTFKQWKSVMRHIGEDADE